MEPIYTETYKGYTIQIFYDSEPVNPCEEWESFGTIVTWHRKYNLGHEQPKIESDEWYYTHKHNSLILPLFLFDHSGMTISSSPCSLLLRKRELGVNPSDLHPFSCPWDSGQVGYIYVSFDRVRKEYGVKRISRKVREKALSLLKSEVKTYDDYLTGNVYGFVILKGEEEINSCWGFFGDYDAEGGCLEEARRVVDCLEEKELSLLAHGGLLTS